MRSFLKRCGNAISLALISPCALSCWLAHLVCPRSEVVFEFWAHCWALAPGLPGMYVRRAYYRWTLESCAADWYIGFGACFTHRTARVETGAYVGTYALVGSAWLHEGCLIGSRASILSGGEQHELGADGRWTATDVARLKRVEIGEHAWLGEGAIVLADVGAGANVAAGAVVGNQVPKRVLVAGNPARFIRHLRPAENETETARESSRPMASASRAADQTAEGDVR